MGITGTLGRHIAPKVGQLAPGVTSRGILQALNRAIDGVGPLPPAAKAADKQLAEQHGNVDKAIHEVIENNVRMAGAQGFITNLGGIATAAITLPTNITGLALIQCRMIAGIAHLHGHDLADPRVRDAVLAALLGPDVVAELLKKKKIPGTPLALATVSAPDPEITNLLASEVATQLISRIAGKRAITLVGRRIPVVGGVFGAGADGYGTWRAGRYAEKELRPRARR